MRVDPYYVAKLSGAISQASNTEQKLTTELSSGLRVGTLSDDPVAVSQNALLSSSVGRLDSFVQSAARGESLLQVSDSTLGEVVTQVTSALSLAVSASNETLTPANRSAIAKQVSDLRDSVLSLANTSYLGNYIFAGSRGNVKPFTLDQTTTPATVSYGGDAATQKLETPDGQKIQMNVSGSDIFTASGADLLGTLNKLISDVSGASIAGIQSDTAALSAALGHVSEQRSTIGSSLSRLNATSGYAQTQETVLQAQQSALLAANPVTIATDLKTSEVQHQALFSVIAALSKVNLFDYLK